MKTVLIIGAGGFVGGYLEARLKPAFQVIGVDKEPRQDGHHRVDVTNPDALLSVVKEIAPDAIVPLAASMKDHPATLFRTNVIGFENLLDSVRRYQDISGKRPLILFPNSSAIYDPQNVVPIDESAALCPTSYYGMTKYVALLKAREYSRMYGLRVIGMRIFNLCGPGQPAGFVISGFCRQAAQLDSMPSSRRVIETGSLNFVRDFIDVRDAVGAMERMIHMTPDTWNGHDDFNICSGIATPISSVIGILKELVPFEFEIRESRHAENASAITQSWGSREKLSNVYGWKPEIPLQKSVEDTYRYWRDEISMKERV